MNNENEISKKILDFLNEYDVKLSKGYDDEAWDYFNHENIHMHPLWNGYRCEKCQSRIAVMNKDGFCVKCLVIREKKDAINKIINFIYFIKASEPTTIPTTIIQHKKEAKNKHGQKNRSRIVNQIR